MRKTFALSALVCLLGGSAFAAAPPAGGAVAAKPAAAAAATAGKVGVMVAAPKFSCSVVPVNPPASADLFQTTSFTIKLESGTLPKGKKIATRLGIQPSGGVLTTFCTDGFGRGKTQTASSVIVAPPIMDANYIWQCNAVITAEACDPPPAVPR